MKYKLGVKAIIQKEDKILILKRASHDDHKPEIWETVGGGMDHEISPQEELKREVLEETGLEIEVGEPFNVFTFVKDNGEFKVGITFVCDYISGDVKLSDEHIDYKWIKPEDFKNYKSVDSLHKEIKKYAEQ